MKSAPPDLLNLLTTAQQFWMADLYTVALVDGTVLRYTSADVDIIVGARQFSASGPIISRGRTRVVLGLQVDTLDLKFTADASHLVGGAPFVQVATNGALDGAELDLERAFAAAPGEAIVGTVLLFSGRVSDTKANGLSVQMIARSHLELLNVPMPRNLYQPPCMNSLYDAGCGVARAAHAVNSAVASGSTRQHINCALTEAAGHFDIGEIVITSGPNIGVRRTVRSYTPGLVRLAYPLPYTSTVGNTFTIYPGCDKRLATCDSKFGNKPRFRGTPFVPVPETAL